MSKAISMKALILAVATLATVAGAAGAADAQGYSNNRGSDQNYRGSDQGQRDSGNHRGWGREQNSDHRWRRGERVGYDNWRNARAVDYRQHHLRQPPRGYEWRESNGQYILAAVATGLIASIILNGSR